MGRLSPADLHTVYGLRCPNMPLRDPTPCLRSGLSLLHHQFPGEHSRFKSRASANFAIPAMHEVIENTTSIHSSDIHGRRDWIEFGHGRRLPTRWFLKFQIDTVLYRIRCAFCGR
jgi:hypothetical protein